MSRRLGRGGETPAPAPFCLLSRRDFLACIAAAFGTSCKSPEPAPQAPPSRQRVILIHSESATAGAGLLRLVNVHVPEASVVVWPQPPEALQSADFVVDSSRSLEAARAAAGTPYGIFGNTFSSHDAKDSALVLLLSRAEFVYTRDTTSLEELRRAGVAKPVTGLAPDAAFSSRLSNDQAAKAFLSESRLEPKTFIAVEGSGPYKHRGNAKLRDAIVVWVRKTGLQALVGPQSHAELYNGLPADVKAKVVRRRTDWLAGEAASVYRRAIAVASLDEDPLVTAAANDIPGIYVQPPEDAAKGQMWKDIGLAEWRLEMEQTTGQQIAEGLMKIHNEYSVSQVIVHEAVIYARSLQSAAMDTLRSAVKK